MLIRSLRNPHAIGGITAPAVLTILLLYWWGRRLFGERAAFLSALILCLMPRYLYLGRMLTTDVLLALWTTAALLAALRAVVQPSRLHIAGEPPTPQFENAAAKRRAWAARWWWLSAVACGLGILTKGPVALALVVPPVIIFALLNRRSVRPSLLAWVGYIAVALGSAAPWYLSMAFYDWQAFVDFFWIHHIVRFTAPLDHAKPFWFFLPSVLLGTLPWSLALIPLAGYVIRNRQRLLSGRLPHFAFPMLSCMWIVLFFSCAGCKRAVYILPALPMLALALGGFLSRAVRWKSAPWSGVIVFSLPSGYKRVAVVLTALIVYAAINLAIVAAVVQLWDVQEAAIVALCAAGILAAWLYFAQRVSAATVWVCCIAALFLLQWGAVFHLLPDYNRRFSLRGTVRPLAKEIGEKGTTVMCYPRIWESVRFYLRDADVRIDGDDDVQIITERLRAERQSVVLIRRSSLRQFQDLLPVGMEFVPYARQREKVAAGVVRWRRLQQ